jgi:dipeptidyl aminopeptidase/acylaminoacyl peptidase
MKRVVQQVAVLLLFLIPSSYALSQNGSKPVSMTDMTRIVQLGNIAVSPDGRLVAYTVQTIEPDKAKAGEYLYRTQIWMVPFDGSGPARQLTTAATNSTNPFWLDNDRLAFSRTVDNRSQIMVLSMKGGEATPLTTDSRGVSGANFSPNGKQILFSRSTSHDDMVKQMKSLPPWPLEKPGINVMPDTVTKPDPDGDIAAVRAWLAKNEGDESPKVINRLNFQGETGLNPNWSYNHIYVMETEKGSGGKALTNGFFSWGGANWSPDGRTIIFTGNPDSTLHPDRRQGGNNIYVMNSDGSGFRKFISMVGYSLGNPEYSPDGKMISFSASPDEPRGFSQTQIGIANADGSNARVITGNFYRSAGSVTWASDNKSLYFTASANGGTPLYNIDLSGKVTMLTDTDTGVRSYAVTKAGLVYVLTTAQNPYEMYTRPVQGGTPKAITTHNSSWISERRVSSPVKATLKRPDGLEIEYWIIKPAFAEPGKKYPLVLNIHGGPQAMWGTGEPSMWHEFQFLASKNYGTVFANPRGSGGYGVDFQYANYQDWGHGPAGDVLAAVDMALQQDWVDPERLVITGGSYAGYLTAWIVAFDHRFKAAYAQRGVYDLDTFLGEGNAWRLVPNHFGGYPWEDAIQPILERESPLTYVDQIKTPLLIKHGDVDLRTGVIQSEMLYKSLKILERDVEYVRVPGASHELSRTGNVRHRFDRMLRIWEFFERYVGE